MKQSSVESLGRISCAVLIFKLVLSASCYVTPLRNTSDAEVIGAEPGPRAGKFLFETIFGLEETSYNSDDDDTPSAQNTLKSCDCGE